MKIKLTKYSFHFFTLLYFIHKFSLKYAYIWVQLKKKDKMLIRYLKQQPPLKKPQLFL